MKAKPLVLALALSEVAAQSQSLHATGLAASYVNARFGYIISYPADVLVPEPESDNGDGRAFHTRHGAGKLAVWGSYRDEDSEASSLAIAYLYETDCDPAKITYESIKPRLVAFSCIGRNGGIVYHKTLVGKDVLRSVRFDYPYSDRATWNSVVKQVSGSLRAVPE